MRDEFRAEREAEQSKRDYDRLVLAGLLHGVAAVQNHRSLESVVPAMRDWCALIHSQWNRDEIERALWLVEQQVGHEIDLWPDHAAMTDEDIADRAIIRQGVTERCVGSLRPAQPIYNEIKSVNYSEERLDD